MIGEADWQQLLTQYPILGNLPPRLGGKLRSESDCVSVPAGRILFDLDQACRSHLLLIAGSVRVVKPTAAGREMLLYRLQPGDSCIITVACLLGHGTYTARGIVETDALGVVMPQNVFTQLLDESGAFREYIFRFFADRITELMQLVEEIAFRPLAARLAAALLARPHPIGITHQALADELGSVREVVSRILEAFEAQGLVRLERRRIVILNPIGLQQSAGLLRDSSH